MKFDAIIAIASGQPDPLIMPFLTPSIQCKELILLSSDNAIKNGWVSNIKDALKSKGIVITSVPFEQSEGLDDLERVLSHVISDKSKQFAFNANGGTKPMGLIAYEHCFGEDIPVMYLEGNKLTWVNKADQQLEPLSIKQTLKDHEYFASHGFKIIEKDAEFIIGQNIKTL